MVITPNIYLIVLVCETCIHLVSLSQQINICIRIMYRVTDNKTRSNKT